MVADERKARAIGAGPAPTVLPRDISSRTIDPAPLTAEEVFPTAGIVINQQEPPYQVIKSQAVEDCRVAASNSIADLLDESSCTQVVRATLRSPTGEYLVTAGVFNLEDAVAADRAHQQIKPVVNGQQGRFHGMVAGKDTEPIGMPSAQLGWHVRGHFLVYAVIARVDGEQVGAGDPIARQILSDMIELHLRGNVLERRATVPIESADPAG